MGQESRWASVIYPLKESKWDKGHYELLLFTPLLSQANSEQQERNKQHGQNGQRVKMGQQSRWASVSYPLKESKWGFCCLPPDRAKLAVNSNKETNSWAKLAKSQDFRYLPPERVKLTVNSKKETNSRVKMGQGSRWASVIYPLKETKWGKGHYGLLLFIP